MNTVKGILFVIIAMSGETVGHLAFKQAAVKGNFDGGVINIIRSVMRQRKFVGIGFICFLVDILFWTGALRYLEVSMAYPIASLGMILLVLASRIILKEKIEPKRWVGVTLVVAGTILVGLS
jgi:multidrug transporter EmrE-like cation transporter